MDEVVRDILRLKKEKGATILAHYYQDGEIQELADHTGDSLALARIATKVETPVILFCGVHFMAETEANMMWQLEKRFPMHRYHGVPGISCACNKCPHMALNTLEKLRDCLENMSPQIEWQPFVDQSGEVLRRSLLQ